MRGAATSLVIMPSTHTATRQLLPATNTTLAALRLTTKRRTSTAAERVSAQAAHRSANRGGQRVNRTTPHPRGPAGAGVRTAGHPQVRSGTRETGSGTEATETESAVGAALPPANAHACGSTVSTTRTTTTSGKRRAPPRPHLSRLLLRAL